MRNAQGVNGIVVSGTIASPYATISIGGASNPLTGPIIINTGAGTVALTVNGAAGQPAIRAVAGSGGDGLDITPSSTGNAIGISLGTATAFNGIVIANSAGKFVADILANGNFEMGTFSGTQLSFYTNNATRLTIASGGLISSSAPVTVGNGFQVTGAGTTGFAGQGAEMALSAGAAYFQGYDRTALAYLPVIIDGTSIGFYLSGVSTCAVVSGIGFETGIATYLMTSNVGWTNGAGAAAGTLTNAPTAGNPTKWIAVNDNGTVRHIPAW